MTYLRLPSSWAFRGVFALTILALAVGASLAFAAQSEASDDTCSKLPSHDALKQALGEARHDLDGNGGFDLDMWGTIVNRDGVVCVVAFTGEERGDQWPGSRVISAQKANTANTFSLAGLALSTAQLFSAVKSGWPLS